MKVTLEITPEQARVLSNTLKGSTMVLGFALETYEGEGLEKMAEEVEAKMDLFDRVAGALERALSDYQKGGQA